MKAGRRLEQKQTRSRQKEQQDCMVSATRDSTQKRSRQKEQQDCMVRATRDSTQKRSRQREQQDAKRQTAAGDSP